MRISLALVLSLIFFTHLSAQEKNLVNSAVVHDNGNWVEMLASSKVKLDAFFTRYSADLGLDESYHFELVKSSTDAMGFTHNQYQQYFEGLPIENAIYLIHEKDGFVSHANGKIARGLSGAATVNLTEKQGLEIAKESTSGEIFKWEYLQMEALIKRIKKDEEATFYPKAELVYAQANFTSSTPEYVLAYKYDIYIARPEGRQTVYVNANTGAVLYNLEGCHSGAVEGTAETRYHGTQTIITDSISPTEYRLVDTTRGGGIETYDMNEQEDYAAAVDFVDDDNVWDNANDEYDDAATDAHWGAEMFYDYFLNEHGRDSYDGNGSPVISYIHYDAGYFNAFWNGMYATYGDGSANPLVSIDVVAHEFTHGLTGNSAGLIYQDESGALNESFSDIFGAAVEFFALSESADWLIGRENFTFRSMANPNEYNDPDTYFGQNWVTGTQDNGGVHSNSGVQNFWYYLLCTGGEGTNDIDNDYAVDSIGITKASAIAFRNLTTYLTPSSTYADARLGSIRSAIDLYGSCSEEVLAVIQAWYAVGIGPAEIGPDFQTLSILSAESSCDLGSAEQVAMEFRFNPSGCTTTLPPGTEVSLSYQINFSAPVVETITLTDSVHEGDVFMHEFETLVDFSNEGNYNIDCEVIFDGDLFSANNEIEDYRVTNPKILEGDQTLSFGNSLAKDSVYFLSGINGRGRIIGELGSISDNTREIRLNGSGASAENVNVIDSETENFTANPDFLSKVCSCVDLSAWDEAYLNFHMRQTYSPIYSNQFGLDIPYMIAARVTIDGVQVGEQFHPETNNDDPYVYHTLDVSDFAGTDFTLCFEGVHFVNEFEDEDGIGDKTLIDNILFTQVQPVGVKDISTSEFTIYPNPTTGQVFVELGTGKIYDLFVTDLLGNIVLQKSSQRSEGARALDLSGFAKGIYLLSVRTEYGTATKKIVLE